LPLRSTSWRRSKAACAAKVISRPQEAQEPIAVLAQFFHQDGRQVFEQNAAAGELLAITVFGQVGVAAVGGAALLHRLVKRQMLKGVERVVMNEDPNRPLRWQEVSCMLDQMPQIVRAVGDVNRVMRLLGDGS